MSPRELARRRIRAAIWCGYGMLFLLAFAVAALDDEDLAGEPACPFDAAPAVEPMGPGEVDQLLARDAAAYRAGWEACCRSQLPDEPQPRRR